MFLFKKQPFTLHYTAILYEISFLIKIDDFFQLNLKGEGLVRVALYIPTDTS